MSTPTSVRLNPAEVTAGLRRWVIKSLIYVVVMAVILLLAAGRLDWSAGWIYIGTVALIQVLDFLLLPHELLAERSQGRAGTKKWDIPLALTMALVGPLAVYIIAGLDARNSWTAPLPAALQIIAWVLGVLGALLTIEAMIANHYFSGTVRIQSDHTVATGGPYRYVRHPGYVGMLLFYLASPLILGSLWAFVPVAVIVIVTVIRTALEDRTLQRELAGYADYARQTRYRLLPGVW